MVSGCWWPPTFEDKRGHFAYHPWDDCIFSHIYIADFYSKCREIYHTWKTLNHLVSWLLLQDKNNIWSWDGTIAMYSSGLVLTALRFREARLRCQLLLLFNLLVISPTPLQDAFKNCKCLGLQLVDIGHEHLPDHVQWGIRYTVLLDPKKPKELIII